EADLTVTYDAKKVPLSVVLDQMLQKVGMGYYVLSDENNVNDGKVLVRAGRERGYAEGGAATVELPVTVRVQGRDWHTWQGRLSKLPESEAKEIPMPLSN